MITTTGTVCRRAAAWILLVCLVPAGQGVLAQEGASEPASADAAQTVEEGAAQVGNDGQARGKEMSVEELEAFLEKRRAELEAVQENRKVTEAKALRVREALDQRKAELKKIRSELESLCKDREAVKEGSFDKCMTANSTAGRVPVESSTGTGSDADDS